MSLRTVKREADEIFLLAKIRELFLGGPDDNYCGCNFNSLCCINRLVKGLGDVEPIVSPISCKVKFNKEFCSMSLDEGTAGFCTKFSEN